MDKKINRRWLTLGLIGAVMLGVVVLIVPRWVVHTAAGSVAGPRALAKPPAGDAAAAGQASEMLRMTRNAFAACGPPAAPSDVPDGATATRDQMVAAHATVKAFDEATMIYSRCLDTTAYQAGVQFKGVATNEDNRTLNALQVELHNAAIDRDQALANRFNAQVRRFKARPQN